MANMRIIKTRVDGLTGHIEHDVRIEEELSPGQTTYGPMETVGIWPRALMSKFHSVAAPTEQSIRNAHNAWLKDHCVNMVERKRHMEQMSKVAHGFEGTLLSFEDPSEVNSNA